MLRELLEEMRNEVSFLIDAPSPSTRALTRFRFSSILLFEPSFTIRYSRPKTPNT